MSTLPWLLATQTAKAQSPTARAIDMLVGDYHRKGAFDGVVLIAHKGRVLYQKGFGLANRENNLPNTPDTPYRICSITKQFTALLVLQLVEQNKLRLNGVVSDYLPSYRKDTGSKITLKHLLSYTSGLPSLDLLKILYAEPGGAPKN